MPAGIIGANIGGVLAAMQDAQLHKAQLQQQALSLQNQPQMQWLANMQQTLGQFNSLTNAAPPRRTGPNQYFIGRAKSYAHEGEKIIDRISFWTVALGPLSQPIVSRLVVKLERVTDEVERFIEMAG